MIAANGLHELGALGWCPVLGEPEAFQLAPVAGEAGKSRVARTPAKIPRFTSAKTRVSR